MVKIFRFKERKSSVFALEWVINDMLRVSEFGGANIFKPGPVMAIKTSD
jgi:hypothetical protein